LVVFKLMPSPAFASAGSKAESVGRLAQDNQAQGSFDTVNDAVVLRKYTRWIFSTRSSLSFFAGYISLLTLFLFKK